MGALVHAQAARKASRPRLPRRRKPFHLLLGRRGARWALHCLDRGKMNPFASDEMAAGYATARPSVHPRIIDRLRRRLTVPVRRALDVGCGAGLSTRALEGLAKERIGIDFAEAMFRWAKMTAPGAAFSVARAERMPFRAGSIDLITAAGSLNYVDFDAFFPEALRVLAPGGILAVYDFSQGRTFPDSPALDSWYAAFIARYPARPGEARKITPESLARDSRGFQPAGDETFEIALRLTSAAYLEYMLTETNVANAVRDGTPLAEVRSWCAATLPDVFGDRPRDVLFRGYLACLAPVQDFS